MISTRNISCEILVVGAGISGICAAVTAAQNGCSTILLEKENFIGGTVSKAFLTEICGLFYNDENHSAKLLNTGITENIYKILTEFYNNKVKRVGKVKVLPFSDSELLPHLNSLLNSNVLLDLRLNNYAVSLEKENSYIKKVNVINKLTYKTYSITPNMIIDCSGAGNIISAAGEAAVENNDGQLAGAGIVLTQFKKSDTLLPVKVPYHLNQAVKEGILPFSTKFTKVSTAEKKQELIIKVGIDPSVTSDSGVERLLLSVHNYLKGKIQSLKDSTVKAVSSQICHREENKLKGKYTLTENDIISSAKFEDGCVKAAWPIEYWSKNNGLKYKYLNPGGFYEIPERSLESKNIKNLYAAGRCISATSMVLASSRVTGTCISLGEQAAISAVKNVKK